MRSVHKHKQNTTLTNSTVGKKIVFLYGVSDDSINTELKTGYMGTIRDITSLSRGKTMNSVDWDNGSSFALIGGKDQYEILD